MRQSRRPINDISALQARWDAKLKAAGFEDAEDRRTGLLKRWSGIPRGTLSDTPKGRDSCRHVGPLKKGSVRQKLDAATYYRLASLFLHEHSFHTREGRQLWRMHAEGMSIRRIAAVTGKPKIRVWRILRRLKARMLRRPEPRWLAMGTWHGEP